MADLGKVGITVGGEYVETTTYEKYTVVSCCNGAYMSKVETTGNPPTDTNVWLKLVSGEEATDLILGMVKLSSATDITDSTGLALPVTEKNPAVSGSLASDISAESTKVGLLADLTTVIKTSIVNAINSLAIKLGTTDISAIADGTVTGGISTLNSSLPKTITLTITTTVAISPSTNSGSFTVPSYTIPSGYKIASITGACNNGNGDVALVGISDSSFQVYLYNRSTSATIAIGTIITLVVLLIKG